jgi:hypothetical protein
MRSAAVLLFSGRREMRRPSRHVVRTRLRQPRRGVVREAGTPVRPARPAMCRQPSRSAKRRLRVVHAMPRGFVPHVRH